MSGTDFVIGFDIKLDFFTREGTHSASEKSGQFIFKGVGRETDLMFMTGCEDGEMKVSTS